MRKQVTVIIERARGALDTFTGSIVSETSAGYYVAHQHNSVGEWFPKNSAVARCLVK